MSEKFLISNSILLILPSQNFNEEEYLVTSDSLGKAGIKIFIASDSNFLCVGSNGLKVKNDVQLYNIHESNFAGLILIGGKGMRSYWNNSILHSIVRKFVKSKKPVGAICSAPIILAKAGVLTECSTCYPDDRPELEKMGIGYKDESVVSSKKIITAKDPASTKEFIKTFLYELSKN
jgi:protease I